MHEFMWIACFSGYRNMCYSGYFDSVNEEINATIIYVSMHYYVKIVVFIVEIMRKVG